MPVIAAHEVDVKDGTMPIYNGLDCCLTFEVDQARQNLRENNTLIYDFEKAMQAPALEMMLRGFRVDVGEREAAIGLLNSRLTETERIVQHLVIAIQNSYNAKLPNSPKQLLELFYDRMHLKPITKFADGQLKKPMDRATLERLEEQSPWAAPIVNAILLFRDLKKSLQVLETEIDTDWRWRCSYNIAGTSTGRWSSSKSPFMVFNEESNAWKQSGNNFQNISEELRRVFIPDPGFKLYGIDKSQSEARDVGWFLGCIFGDWSYLNACESGDLHTSVTKLLYPEWDWTGDLKKDRQIADRRFYRLFTYRDASKRLGHATNYLGQPREISKQTRIPQNLVEEFQKRYFDAFPGIQRMHQWIASQLQRERYLINSFGRRRDFFDRPNDPDTLKGAVAYMFQSATGDCLNLGLYKLWKKMGTRIQILSQLHDAVYFQAPISESAEVEQALLREALDCIQISQHDLRSGRKMTIPGEVVGGFNWAHKFRLGADGKVEEWNPKGLVGIKVAV